MLRKRRSAATVLHLFQADCGHRKCEDGGAGMSELIKREDAINAVEMFFKDAYIEDSDVHCTDMVYEINHIPAASQWHKIEEPPEENGAYVGWWNCKGTSYWFRCVFYDGRWLFEPGTRKPDYWMPIEPPKE